MIGHSNLVRHQIALRASGCTYHFSEGGRQLMKQRDRVSKYPEERKKVSSITGRFAQAKHRLASHPESHPQILDRLCDNSSSAVLERVAENSQTAPETLRKLSLHDSAEVRCAVSENSNTPDEILRDLARDESPDVRSPGCFPGPPQHQDPGRHAGHRFKPISAGRRS